MLIKTSSWFTRLPPGHVRVGVSRGVPRGASGYRRLRELEPGPWFNSVPVPEYLHRYGAILAGLDTAAIAGRLTELAEGQVPVMACFEAPEKVDAGEVWCHRHVAAAWLEERLGITVEELGYEGRPFERWAFLRARGITPPGYA